MYQRLKSAYKALVPESVSRLFENPIRWLVSLPYRGNRYYCPLCQTKLNRFIVLEDGHALCPRCGSLPRTRRLWFLIEEILEQANDRLTILHFSPPASLRKRILKRITQNKLSVSYQTTDTAGEFTADLAIDLTDNDLPDDSFDLIICYHVLEHIEDDRKAISELFRLLKPNGQALIQTPFLAEEGKAKELPNITTAAQRLQHYGQEDHVRVYTVSALDERLKSAGFTTHIRKTPNGFSDDAERMQLKEVEFVIAANK
ncbi:MAG: methyltransferase domain-containing protein [Bacteroidota bacterium]